MDTSLTLAPKALPAVTFIPEAQRPSDVKVPVVKSLDRAATLPAERPYVAQVVSARLSGAEFPENPAEIAPPERTLRPYDVPMLPADKEESAFDAEEPAQELSVAEDTSVTESVVAKADDSPNQSVSPFETAVTEVAEPADDSAERLPEDNTA